MRLYVKSRIIAIARRRSQRSNPESTARAPDCFAALAITVRDFCRFVSVEHACDFGEVDALLGNAQLVIEDGGQY
jgi:hypothetical protein